jgi:hypothetical protein
MGTPLELAEQYWQHFAFTSNTTLVNVLLSDRSLKSILDYFPEKDWNQKHRAFLCFSIAGRLDLLDEVVDYLERIEAFLK